MRASAVIAASSRRRKFRPPSVPVPSGLAVHASGRYLTRNGVPWAAWGDAPWSLASQLTNAQILAFLTHRAAQGCNSVLIECISHEWAANKPNNIDGVAPFTSMSPVNWVMNDTYWQRVDYIVNTANSLGMVVMMNPAYHGVGDGWIAEYSGVSDAVLQAYGAALAARYTQGNVIWCFGGDHAGDGGAAGNYGSGTTPDRTKQWQIALGIRSVRTTDLMTGHTSRNGVAGTVNGEAFKAWTTGYAGFNLNNVYCRDNVDDAPGLTAVAWGRAGPVPVFNIEAGYENLDGLDTSMVIPAIQSFLSGALGGFYGGHDALWHFGSHSDAPGSPTSILATYLDGSWTGLQNFTALVNAYAWHKMVPQTGTGLVTTALGRGADTVCPSLADDGTFAMIFCPNPNAMTVNLAALSGVSSVRARWWDYPTGSFAAAGTFSPAGTQSFTPPTFTRVLVLDQA